MKMWDRVKEEVLERLMTRVGVLEPTRAPLPSEAWLRLTLWADWLQYGLSNDEVNLEDSPSLKILVTAVILPVAEKLSDADGGRHYIQIMSHLISYAESSLLELFEATPDPTTTDLLKAMAPHINHLSDNDKRARMLFVVGVLFHSLADYIRLSGKASPFTPQEVGGDARCWRKVTA